MPQRIPAPARVALGYALAAGLWIAFSDRLLDSLAPTAAALTRLQTLKGWGFVAVTSLVLYLLLKCHGEAIERSQRALRESEARHRTLVEQLPAVTFLAEARATGKILYVSPQVEQILGFTPEDWLEDPELWASRLLPEDRKRAMADLSLAVEEGRAIRADYRVHARDGRLVWLHEEGRILRGPAGEGVLQGVLFDVTEQKQAEEQVRRWGEELERRVAARTQELDAANRELDGFAYTVSHDLRAPLRAMTGFAAALREDYGDRLDEAGRDYAHRIGAAAEAMDRLIQRLLEYARLGRAELHLVETALGPTVERVADRHRAELPPGGSIEVAVGGLRVRTQRGLLAQILENLLGNAVKFTQPGVPPRVRVWAEEQPGAVRLWVEDRGIGIPAEHLDRVFRAFERLHGVDSYAGTGLGLAIVKKAAERLGGAVGVESEPGAGSRFWVDLPAAEDGNGEVPPNPGGEPGGAGP